MNLIISGEWEYELKMDTPYLNLTGDIWGVLCEYFGANLSHYNGSWLYLPFYYVSESALSIYFFNQVVEIHMYWYAEWSYACGDHLHVGKISTLLEGDFTGINNL